MDEYLVYLHNEGVYAVANIINESYFAEYYIDGCLFSNSFCIDELDVIRLLEEL